MATYGTAIGECLRRWPGAARAAWRHSGGTAAIEFAIIAPVFLIMVLGIIEMGRAMWIKNTLQFAVEETTRYAMVNPSADTAPLETYAGNQVFGATVVTSGNFSATTESSGGVTYVVVTGTYAFESLIPLIPLPDITLSAKSRVPVS